MESLPVSQSIGHAWTLREDNFISCALGLGEGKSQQASLPYSSPEQKREIWASRVNLMHILEGSRERQGLATFVLSFER